MSGLGESDSGLWPQSHSKRFARFKRGRDRSAVVAEALDPGQRRQRPENPDSKHTFALKGQHSLAEYELPGYGTTGREWFLFGRFPGRRRHPLLGWRVVAPLALGAAPTLANSEPVSVRSSNSVRGVLFVAGENQNSPGWVPIRTNRPPAMRVQYQPTTATWTGSEKRKRGARNERKRWEPSGG